MGDSKAKLDLIRQYQRTFQMIHEEISRFDNQQWKQGINSYLTPVNIAMHIYNCLDFYFTDQDDYQWGYRFGGGFWELPVEKLPSKEHLLAFAAEAEAQALRTLEALDFADLEKIRYVNEDGTEVSQLGHAIYALRHTVHHHGELAALAIYHGHEGGSWA